MANIAGSIWLTNAFGGGVVKSFSATRFAVETVDTRERAIAAVKKNPLALFTDFQWFLFKAQNTVYFTAYSKTIFDRESLGNLVGNMVTLAPQLTHGFVGARPGRPFAKHMLNAITSIEEIDEFAGYPDKWLEPGLEVFAEKDLPLFRVKAAVRRNGPDDQGRASIIMVRSSHALMEGSDSALLSRSQNSSHAAMPSQSHKVPLTDRVTYAFIAALTAPLHLVAAHVLSPEKQEMGFRSLTLDRAQIRRVSGKLNVSQRALMFGAVMFALNNDGKGLGNKLIKSIYTSLDAERHDVDDDFFRVRSINADFEVTHDLAAFIQHVHARITEVEGKDTSKMQFILNATFKTHRLLCRLFPFLYGPRFFRFNGNYDIVLTLVPPHRMYGKLTESMMEPVYCGSYHAGSNLCTFVPAREHVTFNFCMRTIHLPQAERIAVLLDELDGE